MSTPGEPQGQWDPTTQTMSPKPRNGMGTAALIVGVLAILTCWWLPIIGFVLGLVALILGVLGRGRVKRMQANNGGIAIGGLVLGLLSMIVNIVVTLLLGFGLFAFFQAGGGQSLGQLQQCLSQAANAGNPAAAQQAIQDCQNQFNQQLPQVGGDQEGG